jgi:hypothetical protein
MKPNYTTPIHMSMICHVDINKLLPKSNNDTKQSVTCTKFYLFAPKQGGKKFSICF